MVKNLPANAGDSSTSGLGRSPEGGNGNPLQYSFLGNPMDKGIWQVTVLGVTEELHTVSKQMEWSWQEVERTKGD